MKKDTFYFRSSDKQRIGYSKWEVEYPTAIVSIVHAFQEDTGKYEQFISYLNQIGITVYSIDLRGHGNTQLMKKKATPPDKERYKKILADINKLNQIIKQENPRVPLILFGHATGSSVIRAYATMKADFDKMIITGIVHPDSRELKWERFKRKFISKDKAMSHSNEDHAFTKEDWNDSDEFVKIFTDKKNLARQSQNIKILILSGANDHVEKFGLYPTKAFKAYREQMLNVVAINYESSRHGVLFGHEKAKVISDIKHFIERY